MAERTSPFPRDRRALAALGPRMLRLAAKRTSGAHPYFVPAEHTAKAREYLRRRPPLLAPEVTVVLEPDPAHRPASSPVTFTTGYLARPTTPTISANFGFDDADLAGGGSDRLIDAMVRWGDAATVAAKVQRTTRPGPTTSACSGLRPRGHFPLAEYRELAPALLGR